jgi:spermidine synthase
VDTWPLGHSSTPVDCIAATADCQTDGNSGTRPLSSREARVSGLTDLRPALRFYVDRPWTPHRTAVAFLLVAVGGHGIVAQVAVLRELMAISAGSEISAGIGLGVWIAAEAAGALLASRVSERKTGPLLLWLAAVSVIAAPVGVLAVILGPRLLGALPGEGIDIPRVAAVTLASGAIPAMTHGALFVLGLAALGASGKGRGNVGPGYVWEGLGTASAATLVWLLLLPRINSVALVALFGIPVVLLSIVEFAFRDSGRRLDLGLLAAGAVAVLLVVVTWRSDEMTRRAWAQSWQGQRVTAVKNSAYGKLVCLDRASQRLLVYDGSTVLSEPESDPSLAEELALVPLLAHPRPRSALVVGPGFRLLPVLVDSPLESIVLVQIDPVLQREAANAAGHKIAAALNHPKVTSITDDPRRFMISNAGRFDCILISDEAPANLAANRFFTREFFVLCRTNLASEGILAISGPGSSWELSPEVKMALDTRTAGLKTAFPHTQLVLLDLPLLLSSASPLDIRPDTLEQRLRDWPWQPAVLQPGYLVGLLSSSRQKLLSATLPAHRQHSTVRVNTDLHPVEVFLGLLRESKLRSPWFADIYEAAARLDPVHLLAAAAALLVIAALGAAKGHYRFADPISISTSGFAGAAISTVVLFAYQSRFGSVFAEIGLLLAAFMVGAVLGGWAGSAVAGSVSGRKVLFMFAEGLLVLASGVLILIAEQGPGFLFLVEQLSVGVAVGAQFPIAAARLSAAPLGSRAGRVAAMDLAGGFLGASVNAVFVLPIWGIAVAVLLVFCLKLTSFLGQTLPRAGIDGVQTLSV